MAYFDSSSETVDALVTTIFILGVSLTITSDYPLIPPNPPWQYALGPLLIAPLSELYGRAILYKICIVLFVATNAACAAAPSLASLVVFRLLAGIMGSCPVTLGAGTVADSMSP
jgi:MFS family permease